MTLDDQMLVCLEIMITGDDMPGLGNWLPALEELERRGYAARVGADFRITDEGAAMCEANARYESSVDACVGPILEE